MKPSNRLFLTLFTVVVFAATAVYAGVKVKVDYDKTVDFAMKTTSLKVYEQGTVVLDISTAADRTVVWRAIASAELQRQRTPAERKQRIDEGIRETLKKFPPKFKK